MRPRSGRLRFGSGTGLFGLVLVLAVSTAARAEAPHPARWIGADAALYLEVSRPSQLLDRVLDDQFQKALRAIPGYSRALQGGSFDKARAVVETIAGQLDTTWAQGLRDLTGGGVVLAIEGSPPRMVAIVTPSDPALLTRANDTLLELAREHAVARGLPEPIKSIEYRGITGYGVGKAAYAILEGRLVIADRAPALKAVVDRVRDGGQAGGTLVENPAWKTQRDRAGAEALAWGFARLDRLRELDPKRFTIPEQGKPQATLLLGSWIDVMKRADWAAATLTWTGDRLGLELSLPRPAGGPAEALRGFVPPAGPAAVAPLNVPGTIASLSLWRDLARIWEARADLFAPEVVQGFAKLDGIAGQFFGGRDFGTGVLGSLTDDWRLVVARQDYEAMKPVPDTKLPAFALIADLKPDDDDDFAQRLKVAFQSFVGLANLGAAQSKAPPLELGSEPFAGVTIATARFMPPKAPPDPKEPVHARHNFSPSTAQVDNHFILSSSVGLTRDLIQALKTPPRREDATLLVQADGAELARLLERNRRRLVMQNMLENGHDQARAGEEVDSLLHLLRLLGQGRLSVQDAAETVRLNVSFALSR